MLHGDKKVREDCSTESRPTTILPVRVKVNHASRQYDQRKCLSLSRIPTVFQRIGSNVLYAQQNYRASSYCRIHSKPTIGEKLLGIGCPDNCHGCRRIPLKGTTSPENNVINKGKMKAGSKSNARSKKSRPLNIVGLKSLLGRRVSTRCLGKSFESKKQRQINVHRNRSSAGQINSPERIQRVLHLPDLKLPETKCLETENKRFRCIDPKKNLYSGCGQNGIQQVCKGENLGENSRLFREKRLILKIDMSALIMVNDLHLPGKPMRT